MGFFDSIKLMFGDSLLDEVIAAYGLTRRLPEGSLRRSSSALKRWYGHAYNCPVIIEQGYNKKSWYVTAGDMGPNEEDEDSIFLERFDPSQTGSGPGPADDEIDKYLAWAGPAVAEQYLIGGMPESGDYSVLKHPAVGRILPAFSPAVDMVDLYYNRHAVVIYVNRPGLDRFIFDKDLALATDLAKALGG